MSSVKRGSKEFYEMIDSFELHLKNSHIYVTDMSKVSKDDSENLPKTYFYNNGSVNNMFLMFMAGYVSAKSEYQ